MKIIANVVTWAACIAFMISVGMLDADPVRAVCIMFVSLIPLTVRGVTYQEKQWRERRR